MKSFAAFKKIAGSENFELQGNIYGNFDAVPNGDKEGVIVARVDDAALKIIYELEHSEFPFLIADGVAYHPGYDESEEIPFD